MHERLGEYKLVEEHPISFGALTVEPVAGSNPSFTGVHTAPPLPELMTNWRSDLAQVRQLLETGKGSVVAGDFNATLHHGALLPGSAADAALEAGAAEGTWPTDMGGAVSSQIDYIFISNYGANRVAEARTFNPGGSDHRAVTAQLSLCAEHRPVS
ncbi:MAG: endonuclease/exonuclease/phosphatase family protein [Rothia sp. (in: high G+C Gram-positive bacteria)]|nr:endonuclease/exonuclease/phosphatase family protein [Rothia sp. (in: high G+C Gram-positive bacteria)]